MREPRHPGQPSLLRAVPEVRLGVVGALLLASAAPLARLHPSTGPTVATYAVVVGVAALVLPLLQGLLAGLTAWGVVTGFDVHALGRLTLGGADLDRLTVLVAVAGAAWLAAWALGAYRGTRTSTRPGRHSIVSSRPSPMASPSS